MLPPWNDTQSSNTSLFFHEVLVENPWDKELIGKFLSELPKPLHTYANYFEWKSPLPFIKLKAELSLGKGSFKPIIAKHFLKLFLGKLLRTMWEFSFLVCVYPDYLSLRLGIRPGAGLFVFCSVSLLDEAFFQVFPVNWATALQLCVEQQQARVNKSCRTGIATSLWDLNISVYFSGHALWNLTASRGSGKNRNTGAECVALPALLLSPVPSRRRLVGEDWI